MYYFYDTRYFYIFMCICWLLYHIELAQCTVMDYLKLNNNVFTYLPQEFSFKVGGSCRRIYYVF